MKKVYSFLTLALLLFANAAYAAVTLGDLKTSVAAGDQVLIGSPYSAESYREDGTKWIGSSKVSPTYTVSEAPVANNVFTLETATQTISGKTAFYLKNNRNGLYLAAPKFSLDADDGTSTATLTYVSDAAEANAFAFVSAPEGAQLLGYTGSREVPEDAFFVMTESEDGTLHAINVAYGSPTLATYNDWGGWLQVYASDEIEDPLTDLIELVVEIQKIAYYPDPNNSENVTEIRAFLGGTAPGYRPVDVVENFYTTFENIYEFVESGEAERNVDACPEKAAQLEAAYQAVLNSSVVPMTDGYYRLVNAATVFTTVQGVKKAAYATTDGKGAWTTIDSLALNQVWELKKLDEDKWSIMNVSTKQYIATGAQSVQVTLADETSNSFRIELLDQDGQYGLRLNDPDMPLHAAQHNNGAGASGTIVLWENGSCTASAWFVEPLSAEEIKEIGDATAQQERDAKLAELLAQAKEKYNVAAEYNPLITNAEQITSNASQNELGNKDGDGYPALIDGNPQTYFHSAWGGDAPDEDHYLQVELNKAVDVLMFEWTYRVSQQFTWANKPADVTIYGAKEGADVSAADSWTQILQVTNMAVTEAYPTYISKEYELGDTYKYIRWEVNRTVTNGTSNPGSYNGHYFFALGEFQLYSGLNPDCQLAQMGAIGTALAAAIEEAEGVESATQEDIDKLQAAYDAFVAELADPTELNAAISKANDLAGTIYYGTNPGLYPEGTREEEALTLALEHAESLINDGSYTQTTLAQALTTLNTAYDAFQATAHPIETGKWYNLKFATIYFDETGKNKPTGSYNDGTPVMCGRILTLDGNADDVVEGTTEVHILAEEEIDDPDMALWRFIALGDTAFAIQNKATGLYLNSAGSGVHVKTSITPTQFKTTLKGYGSWLLGGYRLDNASVNPLHSQAAGTVVVGWPADALGSNSMWEIHEVEDVTEDVAGYTSRQVRYGMPYLLCYPVEISDIDGGSIYRISGISEDHLSILDIADEDGIVPAGEPFILMSGTTEEYNTGEATASDTITVTFRFGNEIQGTPIAANYMVGTYYGSTATADHMVIETGENGPYVKALTGNRSIGANSAYINLGGTNLGEATDESTIIPTEKDFTDIVTAIRETIANVNKGTVDVYTTTGVLVRKSVKVAEAVKGLPKGLYIVGGQKTAVK